MSNKRILAILELCCSTESGRKPDAQVQWCGKPVGAMFERGPCPWGNDEADKLQHLAAQHRHHMIEQGFASAAV